MKCVRTDGVKPSTSSLPACQSRSKILGFYMGAEGIEPSTSSLSEKRSTDELRTQNFGLFGGQVREAFYR